MDEVLALVRSRYNYPLMQPSQTLPEQSYDFLWLQRDVIRAFLVGKSCIYPPDDRLRKTFKFYTPKTDSLVLGISLADVESLDQHLEGALKVNIKIYITHAHVIGYCMFQQLTLDPTAVRKLECEFHTANYHTLLAVATGLRTATEHLVEVGLFSSCYMMCCC